MSSRDEILQQVKQNKPEALPRPERFSVVREDEDRVEKFCSVLRSIGGKARRVEGWPEAVYLLQQKVMTGVDLVNAISRLAPYNIDAYTNREAAALETVHTVFLQAEVGVAENGAVWISEAAMGARLLPFICQELVVVVDEKSIVADMHQAYERIAVDRDGYGVFIAGPSKTADIEQSLVIGAHGPLALEVLILKTNTEKR